ncbi:GTP 3',8-cyclase MoaA [Alicyclobacillus sp. ALC3]|uniref:GTP 3',8-cyclase MoaA n=1 Tax=Alicyclobacillus sp. ALC3 TaxID=2796143 RepID=UPI002377ECEB|nr:GTP 3',8-cyclase MoaA [Alicyclobacillus sp. ALC3]WDL97140.1 GTP 3',8-cyclase MoaA [Alicyclobacillus sp. ALC3]
MVVLSDALNRPMQDLRISVTDRCNFRCRYCMPREVFGPDFAFLPHEELLTFEEIARLAALFAAEGVQKVRLTGGEPLLRRDLPELVRMLAKIPGIEDIAMTTNGSLLTLQRARELRDAGLQRVTVSLDSVHDHTFMRMNDVRFPVSRVLAAIEAAQSAGLDPVKVNMVVKRGVNDSEVTDMAGHFRKTGATVRFIEYMDVGNTNGWRLDDVVSADEILAAIAAKWPIEPVPPKRPGEVATRYRYLDGAGEFGVIASVTRPFCSGCTRARLSSDGFLYTCLFGSTGMDLRTPIRSDVSDAEIRDIIEKVWGRRRDRYSEERTDETKQRIKVEMSHIGG